MLCASGSYNNSWHSSLLGLCQRGTTDRPQSVAIQIWDKTNIGERSSFHFVSGRTKPLPGGMTLSLLALSSMKRVTPGHVGLIEDRFLVMALWGLIWFWYTKLKTLKSRFPKKTTNQDENKKKQSHEFPFCSIFLV